MNINIKELLKLDHSIRGYVQHIISRKGKRSANEFGGYHYSFDCHSVLAEDCLYSCENGIYQVLDICHWNQTNELQWNNYLIVVEENEVYCVGEFLDTPSTNWIKESGLALVKKYFREGSLPQVEPTEQPRKSPRGSFSVPKLEISEKPKHPTDKKVEISKKGASSSSSSVPEKSSATNNTLKKKKAAEGRQDASAPLLYGFARLMTFTGMIIGDYKILRHSKSKLQVQTDKGVITFSKEDGKQIDAEKPKYANKVIFNLNK